MVIPTQDFLKWGTYFRWADVLWGYQRGLLGWNAPVLLAQTKTIDSEESYSLLDELAELDKERDWKVGPLLERLAQQNPVPEEISKKKWQWITLRSIYDRRHEFEDPLGMIELVFADFDYPDEMYPFVRWAPEPEDWDSTIVTREDAIAEMMKRWSDYLERIGTELSESSGNL